MMRWRSSTRSMRVPFTDRIRSSGRMPGAVGGAAVHDLHHLDAVVEPVAARACGGSGRGPPAMPR